MNATSTSYYKMCCVDNFISISTSPVLSNSVDVLLMINLTIANCIRCTLVTLVAKQPSTSWKMHSHHLELSKMCGLPRNPQVSLSQSHSDETSRDPLRVYICELAGFAFVLMDDARDAADAVKELDGSRICGKRVKVA